jgi:hypothetical protein
MGGYYRLISTGLHGGRYNIFKVFAPLVMVEAFFLVLKAYIRA